MTRTALNAVSFLFLGFFLGMRHATDADHVVAIATIVSRERTIAGSALIGAAWGIGHTVTVMAVGIAIIAFGAVIPPRLGLSLEFAVGVMLVVLGVLTLTGMGRAVGAANTHEGVGAGHARGLHDHLHAHGDYVHRHPHLVGDAQEMRDNTGGGNDTLSANPDSSNQMYGDAYDMFDNARGGNDTLTGGLGTNRLIGDAYDMFDNARGGNDTLTGGRSANNEMYGDAYAMADNA